MRASCPLGPDYALLNAIPLQITKQILHSTSSNIPLAISVEEIPFLIPYLFFVRTIRQGSTIDGPTQANVYPSVYATDIGISNNPYAINAATVASITYGKNAIKNTARPFPLNDTVSPPLINIMHKHMSLINVAHLEG